MAACARPGRRGGRAGGSRTPGGDDRAAERSSLSAPPGASGPTPGIRGEAPESRPSLQWLFWVAAGLVVALGVWFVESDSPLYRLVFRLGTDHEYLKDTLRQAGWLGPVIFVGLQALQVVVAPIPGELTGFLGGFVFGETLGFVYSTVGLTLGSILAFAVGRWLGTPMVRRFVPPHMWDRMGFLVKAEGAVLCFLIFLIPGFPKDIACYLFGLSPIPFGVFTVLMTLGRIPGTWALSAQGARTATGDYLQVALITALVVAVGLPLYCFRHRLLAWLHRSRVER